ncbi:MAG: hypothetical protein WD025_06675, partial [Bacteriovoracaceae bacterium]
MLKALSYSSLFIAFNAFCLALFYSMLADGVVLARVSLVGIASFISYNAVQLIPVIKEGPLNERAEWMLLHSHGLFAAMALASGAILTLLPQLSLFDWLNYGHLFFLTLFYEKVVADFSLRSAPMLKPFLISYVWTMACAFPQIYEGQDNWWMLPECFLFIFALSALFDIRDIETDKSQGVKTFATELSPSMVKWIAGASMFLSFALLFYNS